MSLSETRFGGNAPGLPGPVPLPPLTAALSRRKALFGAVTVAGVTVAALPGHAQAGALSANDARLDALADEYETLDAFVNATPSEAPGYDDLIGGFTDIEWEMQNLPADSLAGVVAKARLSLSRSPGLLQRPERARGGQVRGPPEVARPRRPPAGLELVDREGVAAPFRRHHLQAIAFGHQLDVHVASHCRLDPRQDDAYGPDRLGGGLAVLPVIAGWDCSGSSPVIVGWCRRAGGDAFASDRIGITIARAADDRAVSETGRPEAAGLPAIMSRGRRAIRAALTV